jgi:anti-sigma factor RsiW
MDQQKLRSLVFEKTGVKIDIDDPIFALVALNEAVLEEAVERHVATIDAASRELAQHARVVGGISAAAAAPSSASVTDADADGARKAAAPDATLASAVTPRDWRLLAAAAGVAIVSALVVLGGQAAFSTPPAAPIVEQAKALTPEQTLALQNAAKLTKAIEKLDPKVRSQLQAELQK